MPDMVCPGGIEDGDSVTHPSACISWIYNPRSSHSYDSIMAAFDLYSHDMLRGTGLKKRIVGNCGFGAAQDAAFVVSNKIEVPRRNGQPGQIQHYIVCCIFCVAHRTEQGIRSTVQHHIKGRKSAVPFINDGGRNKRSRGH